MGVQESGPPAREREPLTNEVLAERAVDVFNASEEGKKVGGLRRTLGDPKVGVARPAPRDDTAVVTVAWELSWYQWEGPCVRAG